MFKYFAATLLVSTTFAVKLAEEMEPTNEEVKAYNAFIDSFVDEADTDFDGMIDRDEPIDAAVKLEKMIAEMMGADFNTSDEDEARKMAASDWYEEFSAGDMLDKEDVKEFAKEEAADMDCEDCEWEPMDPENMPKKKPEAEEKPAEEKPSEEKPAEKKPAEEKPAELAQKKQ